MGYGVPYPHLLRFGWQVDLEQLYPWISEGDAMVVIDGYHSFSAIPDPLRGFGDRFFFLGGGYKYAQSGEGAVFYLSQRYAHGLPSNTGCLRNSNN